MAIKPDDELPDIVKRAMAAPLVDIGQFTRSELYQLNKYVKKGWLSKGKGGPFPKLKTMYAHPTFDFIADREQVIAEVMVLVETEKRLKLGPYSPIFDGSRERRARRRKSQPVDL